jgi:SAM-dependent methyltransferase
MNEQRKYYEQEGVAMTCRSFTEYEKMFVLDQEILEQAVILDIAAGASSFTAAVKSKGIKAYAVDPLYRKSIAEMAEHGRNEIRLSTEKLAKLTETYDWSYYGNIERHRENRLSSLEIFMEDYAKADAKDTYYPSALPELPFATNTFSLVLCSHFLFLYQEQFDYPFHLNAIMEMYRVCRIGGHIRIYPVYDLKGTPYSYLEQLINHLKEQGASVELRASQLPFLPGSTHFLNIHKL